MIETEERSFSVYVGSICCVSGLTYDEALSFVKYNSLSDYEIWEDNGLVND